MTVIVLLLLTVGAGAWYFAMRGADGSVGKFVHARNVYVTAARAVPEAALRVQRRLDFRAFDVAFSASVTRMRAEREVFQRLARDEEGDAAHIAGSAVTTASRGIDAVTAFHDALQRSRITDLNDARQRIDTAIGELDRDARAWRDL